MQTKLTNVQRTLFGLNIKCSFVASSTTAGDTSGPTDVLSSTETAETGTPTTSGDVTATLESPAGGK